MAYDGGTRGPGLEQTHNVTYICMHNIFLQFEDTKGILRNRQSKISVEVFYCKNAGQQIDKTLKKC
jgi:hypothetical protein